MARVTVEDCIDKVDNRFDLVLLAAHRARMISSGSQLTIDRDNDKNPVVALREIADSTISPEDLKEELVHSLQKFVEVDEPEPDTVPLIGSAGALVGSLLMFLQGGFFLHEAWHTIMTEGDAVQKQVTVPVLEAVDSFLFGIVLVIFAYGIAIGFVTLFLVLLGLFTGGAAAAPSKEQVKANAQQAKAKANQTKEQVAEAVASGTEKAKAEVNKRSTRSSEQ